MSVAGDSMGDLLTNMTSDPLFSFGIGMLGAGGPSATPVGFGQALGQGMRAVQGASEQGLQEKLDRAKLTMALMRLHALQNPPPGVSMGLQGTEG